MAMRLSKNKVKFIRRNVGKMTPNQIAAQLKIPLADVNAQLVHNGAARASNGPSHPYGSDYVGFLLVLIFSPLIFSTYFYEFENMPRSLLIQAGAILLPTLWLLRQAKKETFTLERGPACGALVLLFIWALVSIAWSTYRYGAFSQWLHWAACGMFYLLVFNLHTHRKAIAVTLHTIMGAATLVAALGVVQYLYGVDWVPQQVVPAATFNNKNMAAQVMVLVFPVGFVLAATTPNRKMTWVYALVTCLAALFLFYTRSRAAWLGALLETLLICGGMWLYRRKSENPPVFDRNRIMALTATLALLVAAMQLGPNALSSVPGAAPPPIDKKIGENLDLASGRHRVVLWKNTLDIIARHPVAGVGIRNVQVHYPTAPDKRHHRLNLHTQRVHNDYLQMYAELGMPAFLVLGWIVVLMIKAAARLTRSPQSAAWIPEALICLSAMAGLAVNAFFSFPFNRALPPLLLAVYLGLFFKITCLAAGPEDASAGTTTLKGKTAWALTAIGVVVFIFWGMKSYRWGQADHFYRRHVVAFLSGDFDRAALYGEQALAYNPPRGAVMRSLSRLYVRQKAYEKAEPLFQRIEKVFPHAPLNLYHLAVTRINQGRFAEAEEVIRKGLAIIPQSGKLYGLLGVVHQTGGQVEAALQAYRQAIKLSPNVLMHYQWLGQLLYDQKQFEAAIPILTKILEMAPETVGVQVKLGIIYLNRGEPVSAEKHFQKALQLAPDAPDTHRYLGVALLNQGKQDAAASEFQAAIVKSRGRDAAAYNNLGSVLAQQDKLQEAVDQFEAALKINPNFTDARNNLDKVRQLLNR
jgi:tetratricopeptide (TPR) repeat protein/O-antigen ligase